MNFTDEQNELDKYKRRATMFNNLFSNDSIHTQSANETEKRIRAREEQWLMQPEVVGIEKAQSGKRSYNPITARFAGVFSWSKGLSQTLAGKVSR
jgi:hypothetical protein